ncbi:MAG: WYL domain-containing protein [Thermodesulfobacteriota bacterium]
MPSSQAARRTRRRAPSRAPNYGSAGRMMRALVAILRAPHGRELSALAEELDVSHKTAERYARVMVNELPAPDGLPLLELVKPNGRPLLRLRGAAGAVDSNAYQAASVFFALAALRVLQGTIVHESASELWDKFKQRLPSDTRRLLEHVDRKFFYVPFAAKDYSKLEEHMDTILRSVLKQEWLDVDYRHANRRRTKHRFAPYTVVLYRDALYLLGASHRHRNPIYLAVDRIESVKRTGERFALPASYSPRAFTEGVPGIWSGAETTVSLRLKGRAAEQIPERLIHPSQSFATLRGGETLMRMTVRGWQELAWWILSWGADVEVLEPEDLRSFVKRTLQTASAVYARPARPT